MSGISYTTFERDFRFENRIGKGNYATVLKVQHLLDLRSYAHKAIEVPTPEEMAQAFNEIETNRSIDDEHIAKIMYYYTRENKRTGKFQLGLIMELCDANLAETIRQRQRKKTVFKLAELKDFLGMMLPFFARMQRKGYLHRDIKPDNILLVKNAFQKTEYKVCDFGFSIRLNSYSTQNIAGTMEYVSPKLLVKFKDNKVVVPGHNFRDDVYSFGKTLYQFMTLEINATVDPKKIYQASTRYGIEYVGLLNLMLKEVEAERPDFIYLQNFALKEGLIGEVSEMCKNNQLSISTVNGATSKPRLSLSAIGKKSHSKDKLSSDFAKTRKKEYDVDNDTTKLDLNSSNTNLKLSLVSDEVVKKKVINYNEDIHSLALTESFLFIGSEGKLGIMVIANEKIIKLKYDSNNRAITCIKVDPTKRLLFFGSLDNKLVGIEITEIKKLVIQNNDQFKKKNELEMSLSQMKHRVIEANLPISTFDCFYPKDAKQPAFVIGHYNGDITCINGEKKITQGSFSRAPITHIAVHEGCIYSSSTDGVFKRELELCNAEWKSKEGEGKNYRFAVHEKNAYYKYHEMFVSFQMIENCKANEGIKDTNKLLAIVISYDGMAHIVSRSFKMERVLRLTQANILAATFFSNPSGELGVSAFVIDTEGDVYSQEGKLIEKSEQKKVGCIAGQQGQLYIGGFLKKLAVISRKEAVKIE